MYISIYAFNILFPHFSINIYPNAFSMYQYSLKKYIHNELEKYPDAFSVYQYSLKIYISIYDSIYYIQLVREILTLMLPWEISYPCLCSYFYNYHIIVTSFHLFLVPLCVPPILGSIQSSSKILYASKQCETPSLSNRPGIFGPTKFELQLL